MVTTTDKVKKTRNRVPISCEHCRKRKQKCDRKKPCGNCVKNGLASSCRYAAVQKGSSPNTPKVNLNNELIKLKLHINKLERIIQMHNIDLSEYKDVIPELLDDDAISESEDPMVSLSEKFDSMMIKENKVMHSGTTSLITLVLRDKQLASIFKDVHESHKIIYEKYKAAMKQKVSDFNFNFDEEHVKWLTCAPDAASCGESADDPSSVKINDNALQLQTKLLLETIQDVNKILPPLYVVEGLIDHFFDYVYPLMPLIDEGLFREDLECVLISHGDGKCSVSIAHIQNTSVISMLLLILRFAYLAVNANNVMENSPVLNRMNQEGYSIDTNYPVFAKRLLMLLPCEDAIFKKITLRNIQVLTYLRLYQAYSPEMHEESKENCLTLTMIIQMCRSIGSNRDLSKFPQIFDDPREITIWSRLFFKLLSLDVYNAFEYGCPLIISDNEYDVKLPKLDDTKMEILKKVKKGIPVSKSEQEIRKIVTEFSINRDIALEYELIQLIREGLNEFQNFKQKTKRSKLIKTLNKIQIFVDTRLPSLWELVQPSINESCPHHLFKQFQITRVPLFETKLSALNYLLGFYFLLYLNDLDDNENIPNNTPDSDISDSLEEGNKSGDKSLYVAHAVEIAFILLKFNYDYSKYMGQRISNIISSTNYQIYKTFSNNCEVYLFNKVMSALPRSFFFLASMFIKNIEENDMLVENFVHNFSNTIDAGVVLRWFEISKLENEVVYPEGVSEFSVLIFQHVKNLFFEQYKFKDSFFASWRIQMLIKLFVNHVANTNKQACSEFLMPIKSIGDDDHIFVARSSVNNATPLKFPHFENKPQEVNGESNFAIESDINLAPGNFMSAEILEPSPDSCIPESKFMEDFLNSVAGGNQANLPNFEQTPTDMSQLIFTDRSKNFFDKLKPQALNEDISVFTGDTYEKGDFREFLNSLGVSPHPRHGSGTINSTDPTTQPNGAFTDSSDGSIPTPELFDGFKTQF